MAHKIDMSNGRANMAYRGETPWHGLGFQIAAGDDAATIQKKAGLDFEILKGKVMYQTEGGVLLDGASLNRSVLYRSDTNAPLSVMSTEGFQIHQPAEIMDFIASSARAMGWEIETAGSLNGGRKIWALANIGEEATLPGGDRVKGYLLAATACDGTMASDFRFTSIRVVCDNTLTMATRNGEQDTGGRVKVYHYNTLDIEAVKKQLGIASTVWASFIQQAKELTEIRLSQKKAMKILRKVFEKPSEKIIVGDEIVTDEKFIESSITARKVLELYQGQGIGMDLRSSKGTGWGLVNATTEYYDHASKTRSVDNRLNAAWFGSGATKKQEVVDAIFEMA